ncbi:MAG: ribosomal protein S18-alanine N-acetyltransferase [Betaproteobacteria bacterium]|nr:ribosomal protein S18-alanine N-acetyltransferase [Betaproteobacteria bacterium]MDE2424098.1 ribosomal protein S18-alanine N-acetyltransferase [Betaproteobacteria bacterium]
MTFRFEKMSEQHLPIVMSIEKLAFTHPWSVQNFKDSLRSGSIGFLLGVAGQWVGYTVLMPVIDELHILNFAIDPKEQHKGLGKRLLSLVIEFAVDRHFKDIYLEVRQSNVIASGLYQTQGFVEIGRRKGYYPVVGGREDAIVMRKNL